MPPEAQVSSVNGTQKLVRVFFYGSLKKGFYNFRRWGIEKTTFLGTTAIGKMRLFHNDAYPAAVPDESSPYSLMGEIFDLPEELFKNIERMERGAGYQEITVETILGPTVIFIMMEAPKWWKQVKPKDGNTELLNWDPKEDS